MQKFISASSLNKYQLSYMLIREISNKVKNIAKLNLCEYMEYVLQFTNKEINSHESYFTVHVHRIRQQIVIIWQAYFSTIYNVLYIHDSSR